MPQNISKHILFLCADRSLLAKVAMALLAIWRGHARSARLALPLLRTADLLYGEGGMESLTGTFPGERLSRASQNPWPNRSA